MAYLGPVELIPSPSVAVGFGDFLNGAAGGCAEDVGDADLGGDFGNAEFLVGVEDGLDAYGGDEDRGVVLLAEDFCRKVAVGGLPEHARDDLGGR